MRLAAVCCRGPGARLACARMLRGCKEVLVKRREEEELEGVEGEKVWSPLLCEHICWKHNYTGAQKHTGLHNDFSILQLVERLISLAAKYL